jgi:hypothetical protein
VLLVDERQAVAVEPVVADVLTPDQRLPPILQVDIAATARSRTLPIFVQTSPSRIGAHSLAAIPQLLQVGGNGGVQLRGLGLLLA